MPTFDLLDDKRKKEYLEDAKEAARILEEECMHEKVNSGGYCLVTKEICYYDNQKECPRYEKRPNYKSIINKIIK